MENFKDINDIIDFICKKYNFPKPIPEKEITGKTVKEIFKGNLSDRLYFLFINNTIISVSSTTGYEGELDAPEISTTFDSDFIYDMSRHFFGDDNHIIDEFWGLETDFNTEREKEKEYNDYLRLKDKYGEVLKKVK